MDLKSIKDGMIYLSVFCKGLIEIQERFLKALIRGVFVASDRDLRSDDLKSWVFRSVKIRDSLFVSRRDYERGF